MDGKRAKQQRGFTLVQTIIILAIVSILSAAGVLGVKRSREQYRMQNSARLFATYVERARADSVRRHAATGQEASVEMFGEGTNTYNVTMDYGSGSIETRTFQLEPGIVFGTSAAKVTFDWRGRLLTEAVVFQIKSEYLQDQLPVDVSGSGDVTVWAQHFPDQLIPDVTISTVGDDVDHGTPTPSPSATATPSPTASPTPSDSPTPTPTATATPTPTPNGNGNGSGGSNGNGNNSTPTPTPTPTPSASPSATPLSPCVSTVSPSTLTLSQSNGANQTGTAIFTISNATGVRTISASQAGNGNSLILGLSLVRIDGNGSSIVSVTTKNGAGNRGSFTVNVVTDPACGSGAHLTVVVNN